MNKGLVAFIAAASLATGPLGAAEEAPPALVAIGRDLSGIVGVKLEIRADPALVRDPVLALIGVRLHEAFLDSLKDANVKREMDRIIRSVVIEGWFAGNEMHHVVLRDGVLTVQTLTSQDAVDSLRPLVVEVIKRVAYLDTKHEGHPK